MMSNENFMADSIVFFLRDKGQHCSFVQNCSIARKVNMPRLEKIESWADVWLCWLNSKFGNDASKSSEVFISLETFSFSIIFCSLFTLDWQNRFSFDFPHYSRSHKNVWSILPLIYYRFPIRMVWSGEFFDRKHKSSSVSCEMMGGAVFAWVRRALCI